MHSAKPIRINGRTSSNKQIPSSYNAGIRFLNAPNVSNTGQMQINRKYINNIGNINEVSLLHYQRTANMQMKNLNMEANRYPTVRHPQHQAFVYKTLQYQNHLTLSLQQKLPINPPMQRKFKEQTMPTDVLQQSYKNVEFSIKNSKEILNPQVNKLSNTNKKAMLNTIEKIHTNATHSQEESKLLNERVTDVNPIKHKQVPENSCEAEESRVQVVKDDNKTDIQKDMEQVLNINNENLEADHFEDIINKPTKNGGEKTPMCLINDLARFNKISFQYRLTSEKGPAHCKRFTVTLRLGDEEYTAEGFKIKKAQHLAAKEAIEKTKYRHPTPKTNRRTDGSNLSKSNITPTVELNALAMKLGQQTYYIFDPQQIKNNSNYKFNCQSFEANKGATQQPTNMVENLTNNGKKIPTLDQRRKFLSKYQNRYAPFQQSLQNCSAPAVYTCFPSTSPCKITLIVGTKQFVGVGRTLQQAKHDAASNALQVLKDQMRAEQPEIHKDSDKDNGNKSPISLVFEIGIKRNLPVEFKVQGEEGPAHMRTFITSCKVGDIITEAHGNGKKTSKKAAAKKMLEELKKLPPLTPVPPTAKYVKLKVSKKSSSHSKNINLVEPKEGVRMRRRKKTCTELEAAKTISKVVESQENKEKDPAYNIISEFDKETSRTNQFLMDTSTNKSMAQDVGNSTKLSKRDIAQDSLMPMTKSEQHPEKTAETDCITKAVNTTSEMNKNVTEMENKVLCPQPEKLDKITTNTSSSTSAIAIDPEASNTTNTLSKSKNLHMKDKLLYLAKLLGFDVEFSDYPKGNHNEFLTIVMLSTNPPQICHGVGANAKESQEDAAKNALKILSEMGLNNAVNP